MRRYQVERRLTHDEYGETLEPSVQRRLLAEFFRYFGGTVHDVKYQSRVVDADKVAEYLDDAFVYLARYIHMSPESFDRLGLLELERIIRKTGKWLLAEHGRDENGEPRKKETRDGPFT